MKLSNKITNLNDIPTGNYVGYYWLSDAEEPMQVTGDFNPVLNDNNFIIEAMLYDEVQNISVMMQHTGELQIDVFDLNQIDLNQSVKKMYIPYGLPGGIAKVKFRQIWLPEEDELCENMPVLRLKAVVFTGFGISTITDQSNV